MTSLDGINGRSLQTLLRGEKGSKHESDESDEFQAKHNCANLIHFIRLLDSKKGLAIHKRKFLLNRLFVTQSIPNDKDRPGLGLIKSCISATYVVSRPEFNGSELLIKVFSRVLMVSRRHY